MKKKLSRLLSDRSKAMPILSFPSVKLTNTTVSELLSSAEKQSVGILKIAERYPVSASLNMMDLSVEAEAFGAEVVFSDYEIPTVRKGIIEDISLVGDIAVPRLSERALRYVGGVRLTKAKAPDKTVLCGAIGPYSLAGRLYDMTELMYACYDDPDAVKILLEKATDFIIKFISEYKKAGADGVILAEPAAGLLSPKFCAEFSNEYVKRIFDELNSDDFLLIYHNCGNVLPLLGGIGKLGADGYHFGNAVALEKVFEIMPSSSVIMGNVDPVALKSKTAAEVYADTTALLCKVGRKENFFPSTGCDVPWDAKEECIDAFFRAVSDFYL